MIEREFLGWDRPFLPLAVEWLLARRDKLPGILVVVPTAQGGRRLREALAEAAGAVLAPQVVVPGSFLRSRDEESAPDWMERVAWVEVLESITDWTPFAALFPQSPAGGPGWAGGLATEMVRLRHALQENGLLLASASRKLQATVEAERWAALAALEERVERKLQSWGAESRSRLLADGLQMPPGVSEIVLAGVAEMPPLVERALMAWSGPVTALIGAPEDEAANFSPTGRPLEIWAERPLPWPDGSVQVVADPRQQAIEALRVIGERQSPSDEVALCAADAEVGDELARAFTRAGWPAFHPAALEVTTGLARWFAVWREWLADATLATLADLLTLPETGVLVGGRRAQKASALAESRDRWMIVRPEDLRRRVAAEDFKSDRDRESAEELAMSAESLENWRHSFLGGNFTESLGRILEIFAGVPSAAEAATAMSAWLAEARPLIAKVNRGAGFWIDLMVSEMPSPAPLPPPGRVLDVQGWLEIFHEPGAHLVLCGMNEGKVPARGGGEPWLGEAIRERLGLIKDASRAARDAFLFRALLEARRDGGRVDAICGKSGAGGEALLPSRLLLAGKRDELPARVRQLFKDVEPPEAGLRWHADWKWQPRAVAPPARLSVTSLGDYLACPFRFYLKQVVRMQSSDATRGEWNARDFGTVAHSVLERWGRDTDARESQDAEEIHGWLSAELDRVVAGWFGKRVPLAVRIQTENLRQRFIWLARAQAENRAKGWQVTDVERKIEIAAGAATLRGTIDRIDRHLDTGRLRVLDYKSGKVDGVEQAHRRKMTSGTQLAAHLNIDCPAVYESEQKGKPAQFRWVNLQLPLYAAAMLDHGGTMPEPAYFGFGATESETGIHRWEQFETADLDAARACAEWIAGKVASAEFWPPAEKVPYDDYASLAAGRDFTGMFAPAGETAIPDTPNG